MVQTYAFMHSGVGTSGMKVARLMALVLMLLLCASMVTAFTTHGPRSFEKPSRILFHTAMSESAEEQRMLVALQSGLSLRERRRGSLAILPNETLPEERIGLSLSLFSIMGISSSLLTAGIVAPPWDVALFGLLTIAVSMLVQVLLSPTCLDGQGSFGQCLRDVGWHVQSLSRRLAAMATALSQQPSVQRARATVARSLYGAGVLLRATSVRTSQLLAPVRRSCTIWAEGIGLPSAWCALNERWRQTPMAAELWRMKAHWEWNWKKFLSELESQQRQEAMAAALTRAVEQRKRAEGESR